MSALCTWTTSSFSQICSIHICPNCGTCWIAYANGPFIQPDKSELLHSQVPYLGFIVTEVGIKPNPTKVGVIRNCPEHKNVCDIERFLGLAGFHRRFIPRLFRNR